ncbi:MAG TPA: glucosyl transferase [Ignavibacteria bacterium]|nr:glucosyl transferase [Ignavibacteria bacterium]
MRTKQKLFLLLLLFTSALTFTLFSCSSPTQPPQKNYGKITLSLEDVSSTEAWVNLKAQSISYPAQINLVLDNKALTGITLTSGDTTVYIDSLQPDRSYRFAAQFTQNNGTVSSNRLTIQTMDTTSNNFTWQTYTFGGANGSSVLFDVAIINDSDIWAVGEIHTKETDQWNADSTKWIQPYNAVHWNGHKWELKRIAGSGYPRSVVYAFGENDVWFDGTIHWDGVNYTVHMEGFPLLPNGDGWRINSMWGTSSEDFYIVGNGGNIAHYNGSKWTKIENPEVVNGTDLDIYDIWGDYDEKKGKYEIIAVGGYPNSNNRKILKISRDKVVELPTNGINWSLVGIWFKSNKCYYTAGDGIYYKHLLSDNNWDSSLESITKYYTGAIRGISRNDIFLAGSYGEVLHFNGKAWRSYRGNALPDEANLMKGISYKGDIVSIVGLDGRRGIIYMGKRN